MSVEVERATVPCTVCGAHVSELRRGRCWGCYAQWSELRPVGKGAHCTVCHERRRDYLRMVELHNRSLPLCHICAARVVRLGAVPDSVEGLRRALARDRRQGPRRGDGIDRRIFPRERRVGDRRGPPRKDAAHADTDPNIQIPEFDDLCIELGDDDIDEIEMTVVREAPVKR